MPTYHVPSAGLVLTLEAGLSMANQVPDLM